MRPPYDWQWPHPQSWREAYAVIYGLLVGFLAVAFILDCLNRTLPNALASLQALAHTLIGR